ncbi:hypothetical protein EDC04DRAFT_3061487 [Pisolithus marmoratus]|nr:hypothetical protein EDC04DRAFT_3061487 [Pisolithus marmoratus]
MMLLDSKSALKLLSEQAPQYTVVLNGRIVRDTTPRPLVGQSADVYQGTLQPGEIKVAVRPFTLLLLLSRRPSTRSTRTTPVVETSSRNVQPLLGISTDFSATVSLIHPWMEKGNVFDYVQDESVDPRPLLLGIANGLRYLHAMNLVLSCMEV